MEERTKRRNPTEDQAIRPWLCEIHYYLVEIDWHLFSASQKKLHNPAEVCSHETNDSSQQRENDKCNKSKYFGIFWMFRLCESFSALGCFVHRSGIAGNAAYLISVLCFVFYVILLSF